MRSHPTDIEADSMIALDRPSIVCLYPASQLVEREKMSYLGHFPDASVGDRAWIAYEDQHGTILQFEYEGNGVLVRLEDGSEVNAAKQQVFPPRL